VKQGIGWTRENGDARIWCLNRRRGAGLFVSISSPPSMLLALLFMSRLALKRVLCVSWWLWGDLFLVADMSLGASSLNVLC
jgi:hypothetical protein